mgnify:CR=1 FL=1|tara:strand:+ start:2468 stop:2899 length:432 start_codon:yes stop_codon:yes gene_type:complete
MIKGIIKTRLKKIENDSGSIYHAFKKSDESFKNFGEVYFSFVKKNVTKGWTLHKQMTLNLVVPVGKIVFNFIDYRDKSSTKNEKNIILMSKEDYFRLTIPPNILFAFRGIENNQNMLVNIADIEHDPNESIKEDLDSHVFEEI